MSMTVGELRKELIKYPPGTLVVLTAHHDGYNDISDLIPIKIREVARPHGLLDGDYRDTYAEHPDAFKAIYLEADDSNKPKQT